MNRTPSSAIDVCAVSSHYAQLYQSFSSPAKLQWTAGSDAITLALFHHLARMKLAGWEHRVEFARARKHSIADFFQDLLAFYLRCTLPEGYDVVLEPSAVAGTNRKTQVDILIRKNGRNHFVIEVKTTIGWARPQETAATPYQVFADRIALVAENFAVPTRSVIYIFEEPTNVTPAFREFYWQQKTKQAVSRAALNYPLSQIFPLFAGTDPYHWRWGPKGKEKQNWYPELSDDEISVEARKRVVTRFETIVAMICDAEAG